MDGQAPPQASQIDRRLEILDAAQACFARAGFHRTTMQDIASEAGMSVGNLYRYFASKDAVIAGLSERDRASAAADFAALEHADDFLAAFRRIGEKYFREEPRERAIVCLEIWAEATRNPEVAAHCAAFEREMLGRMIEAFGRAQARGAIAGTLPPETMARMVMTIADGLYLRRALDPRFDVESEVSRALALVGAILRGDVRAAPTSPEQTDAGASSSTEQTDADASQSEVAP